MPSHDREAFKGSAKPLVSAVFGVYGRVPRSPPKSKIPRQKAIVLIQPRKPRGVQKHRSHYDSNAASSIHNQLKILEMQVSLLSDLINKTLPVDTVDPAVSNSIIYGSSDTVLVAGSDSEQYGEDEYDDVDDEIDALLDETTPVRSTVNLRVRKPFHDLTPKLTFSLNTSDQEAFNREIDDLLGIEDDICY